MHVVWLSVWIGSLVGCLLKLASPHKNPWSWVVAALVGGAGGIVGLYAARVAGFGTEDELPTLMIASAGSATLVLLWAASSRAAYRAKRSRRRSTRPTIVF